jgi:hypothetical protein
MLRSSWKFVLVPVVALAFFGAAPTFPAQSPERPRVFLDTTYAAPAGRQTSVAAGGDLQGALNSAQPGDTIILQAGATYSGNFTLPVKSGTAWIYVQSSALSSLPAAGTRVDPAQASLMPKIVSPNTAPAISTEAGAHSFRFVGVEITTTLASTSATNYNLVLLEAPGGNTSLAQAPTDLVFDRCYIHGTPTGNVRRAILMNSARTAVVDSYLSDVHEVGADSQALVAWNGPGPFKIVNNYLEGAGENVMFGGVDPAIPNLVPSDIEIRKNYLFKPSSWQAGSPSYAGIRWSVKNLLELKNAQRILIDGNLLENNWTDAQNGYGVLFTVRNQDGTAPWSTVRDVTFTNNILRHSGGGVNMMGADYLHPSQPTQRILIQNNLFDDINGTTWNGPGTFFQIVDGGSDVIVDHNTVLQSGNMITASYSSALVPAASFVFTNNIVSYNQYGILGDYGIGLGMLAINAYFPGASFTRNAIVGGLASNFPADNYYPSALGAVGFVDLANRNYVLAPGTPYVRAGTDGKDVGADFTAMAAAMAAGSSPAPAPAPLASTPSAPAAVSMSPSAPAQSSAAAETVTWTNLVNATANSNSVTKTSGCDGCNDAGAISQQQITAGDGYAQFTADANGPLRITGLTQSFAVSNPATIAWGVRFQGNVAEVREGGSYKADTSFVAGDVFRVAVQSGVVRYSKNGAVFYTSQLAPAYPLVLAAALSNRPSTVSNAMISGAAPSGTSGSSGSSGSSSGSGSGTPASAAWSNPVNVTASGNSVTKTAGCDGCSDAGATSQQQITGANGYAQFTADASGLLRIAGLTSSFSLTNPASIAFGIRLQGNIAEVRESGAYRRDTTFAAGDVFRISVQAGVVSYAKNGTVFYTSSQASGSTTLVFGVAIANLNGSIGNVTVASGL